jgi:membrane dipeptidase
MKTTPLIDGHNDLPYLLRLELKNKIYDSKFDFKQGRILFLSNSKTQLLTILQGLTEDPVKSLRTIGPQTLKER